MTETSRPFLDAAGSMHIDDTWRVEIKEAR
jgi:hypothetical protein